MSNAVVPDRVDQTWDLLSPFTGGAYQLHVVGDRVFHAYGGNVVPDEGDKVVEESAVEFLSRGRDPLGAADSRLADVLSAVRARLPDGWHSLRYDASVRTEQGRPVALAVQMACGDVGRGGHRCTEGCAGPVDWAGVAAAAVRFAGGPLAIGLWRDADAGDPWVGRVEARVEPAAG
jgi:hypothetical protein